MKILIVSDNHGDREILSDLVREYQDKVDLMIHCGDSEMSPDDELFSVLKTVRGNNDFQPGFQEQQLLEINGERILVTHGHLQNVNGGLTKLSLLAQQEQASLVFYGHTHQLNTVYDQSILYLNPGSISLPRGQYAGIGGTFAIVAVDASEIEVQYYNRGHQPISELKFRYSCEEL